MDVQEKLSPEELLTSLFSTEVAVGGENEVTLKSNTGSERTISLSEPMAIGTLLNSHGQRIHSDMQIMIDGVAVDRNHIVSPGAEVYIHTHVEGGHD